MGADVRPSNYAVFRGLGSVGKRRVLALLLNMALLCSSSIDSQVKKHEAHLFDDRSCPASPTSRQDHLKIGECDFLRLGQPRAIQLYKFLLFSKSAV